MKAVIEIARIPVEITTTLDSLTVYCRDYLTDNAPAFGVSTNGDDIAYEEQKSMAECAYEGIPYPGYSPAELENTAVYRKIAGKLPEYDALVFHGSAVAVGNKAYLFTAKSGTGKTTHTRLWLKNIEGSYVVNGDKPVIRIIENEVYVCGTPWMGKEAMGTNVCVPLKGICFLERGEENSIRESSLSEMLPRLLGQSYRPPDRTMLMKTVKLIEEIASKVRLYVLTCNMDDGAAFTARDGMSG